MSKSHRYLLKGGDRDGKEDITGGLPDTKWTHMVTKTGMKCQRYKLLDMKTKLGDGTELPTYEYTGVTEGQ